MNSKKCGIFISVFVALGAGIGGWFFMVDTLEGSEQSHLIPLTYYIIIVAVITGFSSAIWGGKLLKLSVVRTLVSFFRKTQWIWFSALIVGIIILNIIGQ